MRIGDVSERTGIPTRMLRYYEQQGLLESRRSSNGYRAYDEDDVACALRVRGLIQSGLSTRMARIVLDIEQLSEDDAAPECSREFAHILADELAAIDERLSCLARSRDAIVRHLELTQHADLVRRTS